MHAWDHSCFCTLTSTWTAVVLLRLWLHHSRLSTMEAVLLINRIQIVDNVQFLTHHWHAGDDLRRLEAGVHAVSGTPGRVFDMIKRRALRTRDIQMLVLDEADEMLNQGFKEQIYDVYRYLPPETQVKLQIQTRFDKMWSQLLVWEITSAHRGHRLSLGDSSIM